MAKAKARRDLEIKEGENLAEITRRVGIAPEVMLARMNMVVIVWWCLDKMVCNVMTKLEVIC